MILKRDFTFRSHSPTIIYSNDYYVASLFIEDTTDVLLIVYKDIVNFLLILSLIADRRIVGWRMSQYEQWKSDNFAESMSYWVRKTLTPSFW